MEIEIHKDLAHPHIVQVFDQIESADGTALIMERVTGGTLFDHVLTNGPLCESEARVLFAQIASAVQYLHAAKRIVHGDIKLENVILTAHNSVRLIDFGFARRNTGPSAIDCVSYAYASPEALLGMQCTEAIDVWSLGVVLYGMVSGRLPFGSVFSGELVESILENRPDYPSGTSEELSDLLDRMLEKEADDRIDIKRVMGHPWVKAVSADMKWASEAPLGWQVQSDLPTDNGMRRSRSLIAMTRVRKFQECTMREM
jgi:serine/threonine protein kinase